MAPPPSSPFDVLAPDLDLEASFLIEASAGTGKTFAIEHLIARYLLKEPKIALDEITVVTFTKKAARQMRQRVRKNLEMSLQGLMDPENVQRSALLAPYLQARIAQGASSIARAITYLQDALENFDQAKITTIHSFCARLLSQDALGGELIGVDQSPQEAQKACEKIVREWIFSKWCLGPFDASSLRQAVRLLSEKPISWREATLVTELVHFARSTIPLRPNLGLESLLQQMRQRVTSDDLSSLAHLLDAAPSPFGYFNETKRGFARSAIALLAKDPRALKDEKDALISLQMLLRWCCSKNLKKGTLDREISSTRPVDQLAAEFADQLKCLEGAINAFLALGRACQIALGPQLMNVGARNFDQVLQRVAQRSRDDSFANFVKAATKVFIVDEFQDTDPLQWEIFERLFLRPKGAVRAIFVGDPKQSIYAFRHADIYTYDKARAFVDRIGTLTTNYRAKPSLVEGLNRLFDVKNVGHFIELPKSRSYLHLPKASVPQIETPAKRLHFLPKAQTFEQLCEITADLIVDLIDKGGLKPIAVLIDTHKRSQILQRILARRDLSVHAQLNRSAGQLPAMTWLKTLLQMVLEPSDRTLRRALLEPPIGLSSSQVNAMFESHALSSGELIDEQKRLMRYVEILTLRKKLRACYLQSGFAALHDQFMRSCWRDDARSVAESMILDRTASERAEWDGVVQLALELEQKGRVYPHELLDALDLATERCDTEKARLQLPQTEASVDVHILTLHSCKGLEFSHVFALGVALSSTKRERPLQWVQVEDDMGQLIATVQSLLTAEQRSLRKSEQEAEKARLLYVALTRAKEQLYIPLPLPFDARREISPLQWLLARFGAVTDDREVLQKRIQKGEFAPFFLWLESQSDDQSSPVAKLSSSLPQNGERAKPKGALRIPLTLPPIFRPQRIAYERTSFSAWQQSQRANSERQRAFEPHDEALARSDRDDEISATRQAAPSEPAHLDEIDTNAWHRLARGPITGVALHSLMEQVIVDRALLNPSHAERLARHLHFPKAVIDQFPWQKMLKEVFEAPICAGQDRFCLSDIHPMSCRPEMEFLMPELDAPASSHPYQGIYWNGFIDLFFEQNGTYYLLDWKSNHLGDGDDAYTDQSVKEQIELCGYLDQAALYAEALKRFLELNCTHRAFGGFIFFFLRGRKAHFIPHGDLLNRPRLLNKDQMRSNLKGDL